MLKITGKQCKTARGLLKWNVHDLANRVKNLQAKRIDSFEHSTVHLMEWENDELVRTFKKAGVAFKADLEVALDQSGAEKDKAVTGTQGGGARIVLDADLTVLSDTSADKTPLPDRNDKEEDG